MSEKIKTLFIVGPTASGKTGLSISLAKKLGGEIISGDSMQIYKGMSIASAAPTREEKGDIPHHLFEFLSYGESFTAYDYLSLARDKIKEVASRGRLPIIVGGTGLYVSALADGINFTDGQTDQKIRKKLEDEFQAKGGDEMLRRLYGIDPETANRLHKNDKKRIIRALEIYLSQGLTITRQNALSKTKENLIDPILIGVNFLDREILYGKINKRVDLMVGKGLLTEAETAFKLNLCSTATQAIGHKELYPYFRGEKSLDEALEDLKQSTRRYAKRQLTWFRKREDIFWVYPDSCEDILECSLRFLKERGIV